MLEYTVFPAPFVKEAVYSSVYVFGAVMKNQMAVAMGTYF
jgi:hypothetical protein